MKLFAGFSQPCIILSLGRSGSNLLCNTIGRSIDVLPVTRFVKHVQDLVYEPDDMSPVHTHEKFSPARTINYKRVFNLRQDCRETILSFILGLHYDRFHQLSSDAAPELVPFEFSDWKWLNNFCMYYKQWHEFYSNQLQADDLVVIYENMIQALSGSVMHYSRTYPEKSKLLLNYNEVCSAINKFQPAMSGSCQRFLTHKNPVDVYQHLCQPLVTIS
jgi:hypothetical protein